MYSFHCTIHALPKEPLSTSVVERAGEKYPTLIVPPSTVGTPFGVSFEAAGMALGKLERMFFEPDGSFAWVSAASGDRWQVDGVLYDRQEKLLYVDLKGDCPPAEFDRLLTTFGWPGTPVMFQLAREALFLDEQAFRRWADAKA
jgi:hypothetical protein